MPKIVDECTKKVLANPDFKPKKGKTKEESAWAICTAMYNRGELKNSTSEGEIMTFAEETALAEDWAEKHKGEYQEIIQVMEKFADGVKAQIITVAESVGKREAMDEIYKLVGALQDSVYSIMANDEVADKKAEILKQIAEFKKIADEKLDALEDFKATDEDRNKQKARAKKYGISIRDGGNVTKPGQWKSVSDDQWGDPVNYSYPCPNYNQTVAAIRYWGKETNKSKYSSKDQGIISARLKRFAKKFGVGGDKEKHGEGDEYEIITFNKKVEYTISENQDGTVNVTQLPIFQLGEHRGYDYNQEWADQVIATHNQLKSEYGFKPPVFIGHKEKEGEEKPAVGLFDNLRLVDDILVADMRVGKQFVNEFPYRSVEVSKSSHDITGLALLGATPPHFKFEPISFKEGDDDKIYLIFSDENINPEGGEIMGDLKFVLDEESKGFFSELFKPLTDLFKGKKKETPDLEKEVYSKDEVEELKKKTENDMVIKFKEGEKKKDLEVLEKVLFKTEDKDQKGEVFAPALKPKILALFAQVDNHTTIKFSEKDKEIETNGYQLLKDVFSQILNSKEAVIELGERSAFQKMEPPDKNEKFSDEDAVRIGKEAAGKVNLEPKKKE
jgi:hypothetical protein